MEKIEKGAAVLGKTLSGRMVWGTLDYLHQNPIVTDKDGNTWLVERKSLRRK